MECGDLQCILSMAEPSYFEYHTFFRWRSPVASKSNRHSLVCNLSLAHAPLLRWIFPLPLEKCGSQMLPQIFKCSLGRFFSTIFKWKMSLWSVESFMGLITRYAPCALVELNHLHLFLLCPKVVLVWCKNLDWISLDYFLSWREILRKNPDYLLIFNSYCHFVISKQYYVLCRAKRC